MKDFKFALRSLGRAPGFTATVVLTLALGIGATTAIFSVVNAVLLTPLPFPQPEELFKLETAFPDGRPSDGALAPLELDRLNDDQPFVQYASGTFRYEGTILDPEGNPLKILAYAVSEGFFEVFGAPMALGRSFTSQDYENQQASGLIISYPVWQNFFGGNPQIIGTSIRIEGTVAPVIGVTGPGFDFPRGTDVWAPMGTGSIPENANILDSYARVAPRVSTEQFQAALGTFREDIQREYPNRTLDYRAQPLADWLVGDLKGTLLILLGATGLLLVIACVNVTNLLLARGTARAKEIAVRVAVGAGRWPIVRQLMTESLLLAVLGGLGGLALAFAGIRLLLAVGPADLPRMDAIPIDANVLLFTLAAMIFTGLLVGFAPAWRLTTTDLSTLVNEGGRGNSTGRGAQRIFSGLVVAQIGLAVVLVVGAGLLVGSYLGLVRTDTGFESDRRLTFEMALPIASYTDYTRIATFYRDLLDRIRALPGVESAGASTTLPLGDELDYLLPYQVVGELPRPEEAQLQARLRAVTVDFFEALSTPLLAGRHFTEADRRGSTGVAIVNQTFVRQYLPDREPLGERIQIPPVFAPGTQASVLGENTVEVAEIVGVVADLKYASLREAPEAALYLPFEQATFRRVTVVVQSSSDNVEGLIPPIRREIADLEPLIPVEFDLYPRIVSASIARERLGMMLFVLFGLVALSLAAVGVYGVISYSVAQRRGEMAVRATLGATSREILQLVLYRGMRVALAGIVIGLLAALSLRQVVASQLYEMSALDPRVLVLSPLLLLGVALLAALLPALRASRIDPALSLRPD